MKTLLKAVLVACCLVVLAAGCASRSDVSGGTDQTAGLDTSGGVSPYAYGRDGRLSGQPITAGPGASSAERVVYFDFDSAEVRSDSLPVIEANARYLVDNPSAAIVLEGHTDERGTREYNIGLGERRSEAVRRMMAAYGVSPQQLRGVSYGEERPAVAGNDEVAWSQNRRVELVY